MMKGANEDNIICTVEGTISYKCLNPFCGYTFAESIEDNYYRHPTIQDVQICPMCHGDEVEMVHFEPPPMRLVCAKKGKKNI